MKKFLLVLFAVLLTFSSVLYGQARRIVLMEEATNASCTPCAQNNPNLQAFFRSSFGGVISVRYHAWWPGADPMYQLNTTDNSARINYYGINGVPNYLMDGTNYGVPGDPEGMYAQMSSDLSEGAPVKILVDANITNTDVTATIKLIGIEPVTQTNLYLRTAVIERMVTYSSPPGSNGEKVFPDVMRKLLPDANGISVSSINPGDTLTFNVNTSVMTEWNWEDLAVVAWLQSDNTKQVVQSGINIPTYIIESDGAMAEFLNLNQTVTKNLSIYNDNAQTINVRVKPTMAEVPSGWNYALQYNGSAIDSVDLSLAPGETANLTLVVNTGADVGSIKLKIFAQNLDDPYNYGYTYSYFGVIKQGSILFVDDDGTGTSEIQYRNAFSTLGYDFTEIPQSSLSALAPAILSSNFDAVVWSVGWGFPALISSDVTFLEAYLDGGGTLFIAGQDIGWDIFENGGTQDLVDFYHNYLDANYIADNSNVFSEEGVTGTIMDGVSFSINNVYTRYPSVIESKSGNSPEILKYTGTSSYGAVAHDAGSYKTIYMAIGLEQISAENVQVDVMQRSLDWFDVTVPVELTSFTGNVNNKGVMLNWSTATELNNNGFEIEKSVDGQNFFRIGFVQGHGTSTEIHNYSYLDKVEYSGGKTFYYRLKQIDFNGQYEYSEVLTVKFDVPAEFILNQNYPNPFNPTTKITYAVPQQSLVSIKVYDLTGQEVANLVNETKEAGTYEINFDATNLASGVYIYQMRAGSFVSVKKMSVLK